MSGILKAAVIVVATMSGATLSSQLPDKDEPTRQSSTVKDTANDEMVPVVLQAAPEEGLDCQIEAQREFVAARRAFIMKKVMVCR